MVRRATPPPGVDQDPRLRPPLRSEAEVLRMAEVLRIMAGESRDHTLKAQVGACRGRKAQCLVEVEKRR